MCKELSKLQRGGSCKLAGYGNTGIVNSLKHQSVALRPYLRYRTKSSRARRIMGIPSKIRTITSQLKRETDASTTARTQAAKNSVFCQVQMFIKTNWHRPTTWLHSLPRWVAWHVRLIIVLILTLWVWLGSTFSTVPDSPVGIFLNPPCFCFVLFF